MSSSSLDFSVGLDRPLPPPSRESVVTTAPFAIPVETVDPSGPFQPMVFQAFHGQGPIVTRHGDDPAVPVAEIVEENEEDAVEDTLPPSPPPPDFEEIAAESRREGFQLGYEEGLRHAAAEQADTVTRISALLQGVASDTEALVRGLETQVVELALAIAEKVIAREASIDPELILNVVRSALSEVNDVSELRIRVNPEDVPLLDNRWQEMLPRSVAERSELVADELVDRGGVLVETRIGYVDSQLKTRLNQVVTTFQAVLDGEPV
jgi:flagellar biosynthesis/type III secretory pathway protein FliH